MRVFPFEDNSKEKVYACKHVLEKQTAIEKVYHLDTPAFAWSFLCNAEKHEKSDIVESTLGEIFIQHPAIAEVASCPLSCMRVKSSETGIWFDFKIKG